MLLYVDKSLKKGAKNEHVQEEVVVELSVVVWINCLLCRRLFTGGLGVKMKDEFSEAKKYAGAKGKYKLKNPEHQRRTVDVRRMTDEQLFTAKFRLQKQAERGEHDMEAILAVASSIDKVLTARRITINPLCMERLKTALNGGITRIE